ncbi:MAG: head protein [Thermomicrobiales bacterium]|jgi:hypothetical protein|nr:head protein [Thermomicrobiales bacterium]
MAAVSGTYTTATAKGIREDLTDAIYNISPEKTPFISMIGRSKAKNTLHEWQTDELEAVDGSNFRAEGNEATFAAPTPTVRVGNYVQISDKTAIVAGTLEAVDKAGRKSEMAYQLSKRSVEIKRDMETIALSNQAASGSDPRKTAGLPAWLKTNISKGAGGVDPVYTSLPNDDRTDGTQRALTEQMIKDVAQLCWTEGAEPSIIMVGGFNKTVISGFAGNADKTLNLAGAKPGVIVQAMDVLVTDFGNLKVVANRFQRTRDLFILDPSFLSIMFLRGFKTHKLAKTGDAEKRLLNAEWGTKLNNEASQGAVYDLTTS